MSDTLDVSPLTHQFVKNLCKFVLKTPNLGVIYGKECFNIVIFKSMIQISLSFSGQANWRGIIDSLVCQILMAPEKLS